MFAIIRSGGKQYRVEKDRIVAVEKLNGEVGSSVEIRDVLLLGVGGQDGTAVAGEPIIADACVRAEIVRQGRLGKITVFKKKRRKNYRRTFGHRQSMTWLRIDGIEAPPGMFPELSGKIAGEAAAEAAVTLQKDGGTADAGPESEQEEGGTSPAAAMETPAYMQGTAEAALERMPDNLVELPGIDEATAKKLNELGVFYFRQIVDPDDRLTRELLVEPMLDEILRREDVKGKASALMQAQEK